MRCTFIMYTEWADMIAKLDLEEQGELLSAIMSYQTEGTVPELSHSVGVAFAQIKMQFDKDSEKYNATLEKRKEASRLGVEARQKKPDDNHTLPHGNQVVGDSDCVCVCDSYLKENTREKSTQEQAFDKFWDLYPKKKSKGQAKKAWDKLHPDKDTIKAIMDKLPELINSPEWKKQGGQFIPYPATWLNAQGWEDEVTKETYTPQKTNAFNDFDQRDTDFDDLEKQLLQRVYGGGA